MKEYIRPELEIVSFESEVITNTGTSGEEGAGGNLD